jgi:hypothetical protein
MIKPKGWRYGAVLVVCGSLGVAALSHAATRTVRIPIERPVAKSAALDPTVICQGEPERLAEITLIPDAVIRQNGRERIEYHGEVVANTTKRLGVAWHADVIDDRGQLVALDVDKGEGRGQGAGDMLVTRALSANLPDGFYALRLRAAVAAEGEPSDVLTAVQHLEVRNGTWSEIEQSDWLARSRASQAFSEAEVKKMGLLP